jgi:hypothetical protein
MPNTAAVDQLTKAQEWALEQMKANQERVIDLNKKVASLVEKLPAVKVPFADRLPDQKDMVSKNFDFLMKSTEANRESPPPSPTCGVARTAPRLPSPPPSPPPRPVRPRRRADLRAVGGVSPARPTARITHAHEPQ